jgi:hypothetical protein
MIRAVLWIVLAIIALGFAAAGWIIVRSFDPEPGAEMALVGLPMIAFPMTGLAIVAIGLANAYGETLTRTERLIAWIAGALSVGVFVVLFMLG